MTSQGGIANPRLHLNAEGAHLDCFRTHLLPLIVGELEKASQHPARLVFKPPKQTRTSFLLEEKIVERGLRPDSKKAGVIGFAPGGLASFAFIDKQVLRSYG